MPGKPKKPGGHGYGRRSKKCIGRRFKPSKKVSSIFDQRIPDKHDKVDSLIIAVTIYL